MSSPSNGNLCYLATILHCWWIPWSTFPEPRILWLPTLKANGLEDG